MLSGSNGLIHRDKRYLKDMSFEQNNEMNMVYIN